MKLAFGLRDVPSDVETAWGARLIWPGDLLHDRQDAKGPDATELMVWLNGGPLRLVLDRMRTGDQAGLTPRDERTVVLYEDGDGVIKGNPQGSHGYLYVAAWLKS